MTSCCRCFVVVVVKIVLFDCSSSKLLFFFYVMPYIGSLMWLTVFVFGITHSNYCTLFHLLICFLVCVMCGRFSLYSPKSDNKNTTIFVSLHNILLFLPSFFSFSFCLSIYNLSFVTLYLSLFRCLFISMSYVSLMVFLKRFLPSLTISQKYFISNTFLFTQKIARKRNRKWHKKSSKFNNGKSTRHTHTCKDHFEAHMICLCLVLQVVSCVVLRWFAIRHRFTILQLYQSSEVGAFDGFPHFLFFFLVPFCCSRNDNAIDNGSQVYVIHTTQGPHITKRKLFGSFLSQISNWLRAFYSSLFLSLYLSLSLLQYYLAAQFSNNCVTRSIHYTRCVLNVE